MQLSPDHLALCFLDDRADLQHKIVAGLPVYSPSTLGDAIFRHELEEIVLAIPSASSAQKRRLIERVEGAGLPVKILPGLFELVDGKAGMSDIREVDVADLLGRDPVPPDPAAVRPQHRRQGRAGHRRRRLDRQRAVPPDRVAASRARCCSSITQRIRALHHRRTSCARAGAGDRARRLLGSVRDERRHARDPAHAWRPRRSTTPPPTSTCRWSSEHPGRACGTTSSARWSSPRCRARRGGRDFVLISTDKAVRPTNVMGATKRAGRADAARRRPCAAARRHVFSMVRFGNVLGSSRLGGAAVPAADRGRRADHDHPPGHHSLLHADRRGRAARHPGRSHGDAAATSSCSTWASRSGSSTWRER